MSDSVSVLSWNIKSGGYSSYSPSISSPERQEPIKQLLNDQHGAGVDTVCLTDTLDWDTLYGGEDGIAKHLGFKAARFTRLNDPRLNAAHGEGIGLSFATDRPIENSYDIDLGNRQGLGVVLGIGAYGLQIANVYLDDLSEDIRTKQIAALLFGLEKGLPTIITGDMNVLRQDMAGASVLTKMKDRGVRALAKTLPKKTEIGITIAEMNKRVAMKQILDAGYIDADSKLKRPTAPAVLPIFGIDYALHTGDVSIEEFDVIRIKGESDHRPIKFKATVE